jgi:uncharacterized SAM-binding protein YcdF (DUF218 family)
MFYLASRIFGFLVTPSNVIATICLIGLVLSLTRWKKAGARIGAVGILLLLVCGFSPLGNVLLLTLSERFPAWVEGGRAPDGIIVLGGAINPDLTAVRGAAEINSSAERMTTAAVLARRFPDAKIVLSGGNANPFHPLSTEAEVGRQLLEGLGVAAGRIVMEDRSRNTYENAIFTRETVHPKAGEQWLLVTSAYHMPRAMGVFRAAGFAVEAYPVDWRTRGWIDARRPFLTLSGGLGRFDTAAHEWIGLVSYRLAGRTNTWFPAP